jgi:hypothetical protein
MIRAPRPLSSVELINFRRLLLGLPISDQTSWPANVLWYQVLYHEPPKWALAGKWPHSRVGVPPEHRELFVHWAFERGYFDSDQLDRFMLDITLELLEP